MKVTGEMMVADQGILKRADYLAYPGVEKGSRRLFRVTGRAKTQPAIADFEGGGDHTPRNAGSLKKLEKVKKGSLL